MSIDEFNKTYEDFIKNEIELTKLCNELKSNTTSTTIDVASLISCISNTEGTIKFFNFVKATYNQIILKNGAEKWGTLLNTKNTYTNTKNQEETVTLPNSFSHIYNIDGSFYGLDPVKTGIMTNIGNILTLTREETKIFAVLNANKLVLPLPGETRPNFETVLSISIKSLNNMNDFLNAYIKLFATLREVDGKVDDPKYITFSSVLEEIEAERGRNNGHLTINALSTAVSKLSSDQAYVTGGSFQEEQEQQETVLQALQNKAQQIQLQQQKIVRKKASS